MKVQSLTSQLPILLAATLPMGMAYADSNVVTSSIKTPSTEIHVDRVDISPSSGGALSLTNQGEVVKPPHLNDAVTLEATLVVGDSTSEFSLSFDPQFPFNYKSVDTTTLLTNITQVGDKFVPEMSRVESGITLSLERLSNTNSKFHINVNYMGEPELETSQQHGFEVSEIKQQVQLVSQYVATLTKEESLCTTLAQSSQPSSKLCFKLL